MLRSLLKPWPLALLLLFLLSWHGGLHSWQVLLASLGILGAWLMALKAWAPSKGQWALLAGLLLWQTAVSIKPQQSMDQGAWLFCLLVLGLSLRREPRPAGRGLGWVVALCLMAALALLGSAAWSVWHDGAAPLARVHSFFPNQNLVAVAFLVPGLLITMAWACQRQRRALAGVVGAALALGLVLAGSRGALLAFLAGALWFAAKAWRQDGLSRRLGLGALLVALVVLAAFKLPLAGLRARAEGEARVSDQGGDPFKYQRLQFWKASLLASAQRPWLGWGLGAYGEAIQRQDTGMELGPFNPIARYRLSLEHAHNELLESAVECGWPVAVVLACFVLAWVWERWHSPAPEPLTWAVEAFLIALLAHAMVDMPFRPPFMQMEALMAWAWLGPVDEAADQLGFSWGTAAALSGAVLLSLGAWIALPLLRGQAPMEAGSWRWLPASILQPLDASLAARRSSVTGEAAPVWMPYFGWEDWAWLQSQEPAGAGRVEWLKRCVGLRPFSVWQRLDLARAEWQAGQADEAQADLNSALALEPNYRAAWQLRLEMAQSFHDHAATLESQAQIARIAALKVPADEALDAYVQRLISVPPTLL